MGFLEILLIGIGLAMDSFAVSICKGLAMKKVKWKETIKISLYFAIFQAVMPLIGFLLGTTLSSVVQKFDHWIIFVLLCTIGLNMIKDTFNKEEEKVNGKIDVKTMLLLSIATSIDALAVGITFSFFRINIIFTVLVIGITTLLLCMLGVKIGTKFGYKFENKASIIGGIILIFMSIKILLEHLSII